MKRFKWRKVLHQNHAVFHQMLFHLAMGINNENEKAVRAISTSKLHALLRFHTWPINEVVFLGSQGRNCFEVGFPLRCLQRLSRPHIATLHCDWRHNRSTGGYVHPGPLVTSDNSSQVPTITEDRDQTVVTSFEPSSHS